MSQLKGNEQWTEGAFTNQLSQFDKGFNNQIGRATAYYMRSFKIYVPTPPKKQTNPHLFLYPNLHTYIMQ